MRSNRAVILKDSGSEADWVSLRFLQRLNYEHKIKPDDEGTQVLTADGRKAVISGSVKLLYHIGDFSEYRTFHVLDGCRDDIILGTPFLTEHQAVLDYGRQTLTITAPSEDGDGSPKQWVFRAQAEAARNRDTPSREYASFRVRWVGKLNRMPARKRQDYVMGQIVVWRTDGGCGGVSLDGPPAPRDPNTVSPACSISIPIFSDSNALLAVNNLSVVSPVREDPEKGQASSRSGLPDSSDNEDKDKRHHGSEGGQAEGASSPPPGPAASATTPTTTTPSERSGDGATGSPSPFDARMEALVARYPHLFEEPFGVIERPGFEHRIKLKEGSAPTKGYAYRMTPRLLEETKRQLQNLVEKGHIRPSKSPYSAPILFVGKKSTGELRMCVDYRKLNAITVKDAYPIPRIDQLIDIFCGAEKFTKLDMASAFNQIPMAKEDIEKTGFTTRYGNYEYLVMPFGLCNAPATCMRYMQHLFHDLLDKSVVVYMDDVAIFSKEAYHEACVEEVFRRLDQARLRLKRSKCEIGVDSISYLGHVISRNGVQMDPSKVETIVKWPEPKNVSDVRSFLGLVGYYRKFLSGFGEISAPLVELTKKDFKWVWDAARCRSFEALKEMLTTAPTLLIPDTSPGNSFVIHVDASDYAVGAVLLQDQGMGLQPCAFFSKKLDAAQRNYSVGDKEMLAMKLALMEFKVYVEGLPTVLCTDHRNNVDLLTRPVDKVASKRIARVIEFMQQFVPHLSLAYIQGEDNLADGPSRRPDYAEASDDDDNYPPGGDAATVLGSPQPTTGDGVNKSDDTKYANSKQHHLSVFLRPLNQVKQIPAAQHGPVQRAHLPADPNNPARLHPVIRCNLLRVEPPGELERDIIAAYARDPLYRRDRRATNVFLRDMVGRAAQEGVFRHKGRIAVPADDSIKKRILQLCHDAQAHIGENKTLASVGLRFWWTDMTKDVRDYVKACEQCQRAKSSTQKPYGLLMPIPPPARNFQVVNVDFLCVDTRSDHKDAILVVVDKRSKYMIAYPTVSTATSRATMQILQREVFDKYATPDALICDNDMRFSSSEFRDFCEDKGIELRFATPYHPQSNGQAERGNKTIKDLMAATVEYPRQWKHLLNRIVRSYNNAVNEATGYPPALLVFEQYAKQPIDKAVPSGYKQYPHDSMQTINAQVDQNLQSAAAKQSKHYNKKRRHITYRPGDKVLVDARYLPRLWASSSARHKFANRREGPYLVVRRTNDNSYVVRVPTGRFNQYQDRKLSIDKLTPFRENERWRDAQLVRHEPGRRVVRIMRHTRVEGHTRRYLVRYGGHHEGLDEWVPGAFIRPKSVLTAYRREHGLRDV